MKNKTLRSPTLMAKLHAKANSPANPPCLLAAILIELLGGALISVLVCKNK
jgi:hypothetical protein